MLLVAMAKEAQRNLQDYSLQDLTDLVWAIAQLGGAQPAEVDQLLDLISDATCSCLQQASQVKIMEISGKTCIPLSADVVVIWIFIGLASCALIATEAWQASHCCLSVMQQLERSCFCRSAVHAMPGMLPRAWTLKST